MNREFDRRSFLTATGAVVLTGVLSRTGVSLAKQAETDTTRQDISNQYQPGQTVHFAGDGVSLTAEEYATRLGELVMQTGFEPDTYAIGGIISTLEHKFAQLLGKETAVFLPTGTLANHLALRRLTNGRNRVIAQADSHLCNDAGDCVQSLSGLNLLTVAGEFTPEAIEEVFARTAHGRVKTDIGAISLESPLRRGFNTGHTPEQARQIADLAHRRGVGVHLDGARLFMQAAHHGFDPAEYAAPFDTVYVSLYKNFNAAGGAILAGQRDLLVDLLHERRMFGGSPCRAWPLAAVALHYCDDYIAAYRRAKENVEKLIEQLADDPRFRFELVPGGSNGVWLHLTGIDPALFVSNLAERHIRLIPPRSQWRGLLLMINPTATRKTAAEIADAFRESAQV